MHPKDSLKDLIIKSIPSLVNTSLKEDIQGIDLAQSFIDPDTTLSCKVYAVETMIFCGKPWAVEIIRTVNNYHNQNHNINLNMHVKEGEQVYQQQHICTIDGSAIGIHACINTLLNLIQTTSATATTTKKMTEIIRSTSCKVIDSRSTIPALRFAQKYAVKYGGGFNFRTSLSDVLLLDYKFESAYGDISEKIAQAKKQLTNIPIEVITHSFEQFQNTINEQPHFLNLHKLSTVEVKKCVQLRDQLAPNTKLIVSGEVNINNLQYIAESGVDMIESTSMTKYLKTTKMYYTIDKL